ncbi:hypothetical protein GGI15_000756 [Coemansia interrupta]|uniref:LYR motif-containing protein Cup1-like N-terminal domain-containing protein n=1 Tax=Coemansia interrupta TaxID=1126814 RepID=A0A9W8HRJ3_9FUNG|nr:hypothetical protein GGI15_000756 [Coemansia interrupta]
MFFDENSREFIQTFAKKKFRENMHDRKPGRPRRKLQNARTAMHLIERANTHNFKDVMSVLEFGYGRKGPRRLELLKAMAGIGKREEIFGSLHSVSRYRPAFYAIAKNQYGEDKLSVNKNILRSRNPLNVAKMQDSHWDMIRHKVLPPVDTNTMRLLEERAESGIVDTSSRLDPGLASIVKMWESKWVKMPPPRQIIRYYRALLTQVTEMQVTKEAPSNAKDSSQRTKYLFRKSSLADKRPPPPASPIDIAML